MRLVVKYGGTTISSAEDIHTAITHLCSLPQQDKLAVVCSATEGTTDVLVDIANYIRKENKPRAKEQALNIINRHRRLAEQVVISDKSATQKILAGIESDSSELLDLIDGMVLLGEVTPRSMDYLFSFGERLSTRIISAALDSSGRTSIPITGKDAGIMTDSNFGKARPLMDTTKLRVAKNLEELFTQGITPVVGGFVGADQHGHLTTLGRGGSDYTATIIGSCIGADEIWLMSRVGGLMTADPKTVQEAKTLRHVSYMEAIEMALFGAKQIHPRTFEPILSTNIPMRIRSSLNTKDMGTLVTASPPSEVRDRVKCVSSIKNNGLVDIQGGSMVGRPGTAAKIFVTLAKAEINVMMISQNPSESSITIVVKNEDIYKAVNVLEMEMLGKLIKKLDITTDVAIIALIGSGMRGTAGVASKVFGAIGAKEINISMITQGSSELNLAFVVKNHDADAAVSALHDAFDLDRIN